MKRVLKFHESTLKMCFHLEISICFMCLRKLFEVCEIWAFVFHTVFHVFLLCFIVVSCLVCFMFLMPIVSLL